MGCFFLQIRTICVKGRVKSSGVLDEWAEAHFFYSLGQMSLKRESYETRIKKLALPLLEEGGMELVELECLWMKTRWLLRLYIDKEGGVTLEDCSAVSNELGDVLEVHDLPQERYTLEVSSPGLDRPLTRDKDFIKYRGKKIRLKLQTAVEGARNVTGELLDYVLQDGVYYLIVASSGKNLQIPRDWIKKANLIYEF